MVHFFKKCIWFKSSAVNSLSVSMKTGRRLRRKGRLEEEIMPETGAIATWE